MNLIKIAVSFVILFAYTFSGTTVSAQETTASDNSETTTSAPTAFLNKHCIRCHGPEEQEGDLRIDTLDVTFKDGSDSDKWVEVLDRINLGEMPPTDEPQPSAEELGDATRWITGQLKLLQHRAVSSGGRVLLRRLTRTEYANTIRDLLGVSFVEGEGPMDMLPPDGAIAGFNKVSKALLLDPSLMEHYLNVAELVADRAIRLRQPLVPTRITRYEFEGHIQGDGELPEESRIARRVENGAILYSGNLRTYSKLGHPFNGKQIPVTGRYKIRLKAGAKQGKRGEPIYMDLHCGSLGVLQRFRVDASIEDPQIYEFEGAMDASQAGETQPLFVNGIGRGANDPLTRFNNNDLNDPSKQGEILHKFSRFRAEGRQAYATRPNPELFNIEEAPALFVDYIEIEGPLQGEWPPKSMSIIFPDGLSKEIETIEYAETIFSRLLPRAYRRPVSEEELATIIGVVRRELEMQKPFHEAIQVGVVAMLCSPQFLYLFEGENAVADGRISQGGGSVKFEEREFQDKRGRVVKGKVDSFDGNNIVFVRSSDNRKFTIAIDSFSEKDQAYLARLSAALDSQNSPPTELRALTDYELATRLSFFLWSSMPDAELFDAAKSGKLSEPRTLVTQIDRMLADEKSQALVDDFAYQWLRLHEFDRFKPDRHIFPEVYTLASAGLNEVMNAQPIEMFREVLTKDESVLSFLDSDWTMLNNQLAEYYGIEGVDGKQFRRVAFKPIEPWMEKMTSIAGQPPTLGPFYSVGPFGGDSFNDAFEDAFPPESGVDLEATYGEATWEKRENWEDGKAHNPFPAQRSAYYLYRTIDSPIKQQLSIAIGADDAFKIFLNGEEISSEQRSNNSIGNSRLKLPLRKGKNELLIKIINNSGGGGYNFAAIPLSDQVRAAFAKTPAERSNPETALINELFIEAEPTAARGGLIGMAGIHKWGSDGIRTKPVERGKYILDVLFNDPPPPPPPNAGEVQPNIRGQNLTVRERLEQHRSVPACANCHRRIDPYGLALENFNAIGKWRTRQDGEKAPHSWYIRRDLEIDGLLPNGEHYTNFSEFKQSLNRQSDRFVRGISEKLLVYALGRPIEPSDRQAVETIAEQARDENYSLRSLIKGIAASRAFQTK